ncbi:hypothetical protein ACFV1L_30340 [Kitasatospora sp. NPDC059646]|uniref:hypothetical protein n=1 Tax=Kitasatospora sp. NPDC059646 TaxID=3346893 RepID=UPI0036A1E93E
MSAGLPPLASEIPCSLLAVGCSVEYRGRTLSLDFRGNVKHRVEADPEDKQTSVRLRIVGFRMTAGEDAETAVLEQSDTDDDAPSRLKLVRPFPPAYEHRQIVDFTATFAFDGEAPVILLAKQPLVLVGTLTRFPPHGDQYKLENPVDLVSPDAPDTVVARITTFPAKQNGL